MPPDIFANTNTSVSILFIDTKNIKDYCVLVDASSFGEKIKDANDNQKTVLRSFETEKIVNSYLNEINENGYLVTVKYDDIKNRNYKINAGQYFSVEVNFEIMDRDKFNKMKKKNINEIKNIIYDNEKLTKEIFEIMEKIENEN